VKVFTRERFRLAYHAQTRCWNEVDLSWKKDRPPRAEGKGGGRGADKGAGRGVGRGAGRGGGRGAARGGSREDQHDSGSKPRNAQDRALQQSMQSYLSHSRPNSW
jgi:hypothetical protein